MKDIRPRGTSTGPKRSNANRRVRRYKTSFHVPATYVLSFLLLAVFPLSSAAADSHHPLPLSDTSSLTVLICLDGVPLDMIQDLRKEGFFRSFHKPAPLISTFPAITEVMLTEFFHVPYAPGYGLRYYDKKQNRLVGGISSADAVSIWFELYDFITPMIDRGMVYLWGRWAWKDIDMVERALARLDTGVFLAHIDSTDALLHHERPKVAHRWLKKFSVMIDTFVQTHPNAEVFLFSDHGNERIPTRRVPVERYLKKAGWHPKGVIEGESGVAILPTGLISTGYLYTRYKRKVARELAWRKGIELTAYEESGVITVFSKKGEARIQRKVVEGRPWYLYEPVIGDPLRYDTFLWRAIDSGWTDSMGYIPARRWFAGTLEERYPYAVDRLYGGLTGHVLNVGDVLLSLEPGWHLGSAFLSFFFHFQGTHGSLRRGSITGFAMA
ncbi:MAG: hypothetical protein D6679_07320, partial [Candidatus Hydrogenedentota bacterium]